MKTITLLLCLFLSGCVYCHVKTPKLDVTYASVGKDIQLDPNGVISTVSPKNENIITAIGAAVAGFVVGGM